MVRLWLINLIFALYVTGCGAADDTKPMAAAPVTDQASARPDAPGITKRPSALAVADQKALPVCDASQEGALAYVKAEDEFYGCAAQSWVQIAVRGDKGPQGDAGQKGDTGAQGVAGTQGAPGKDGEPVAPNTWYDTVSGQHWTTSDVQVAIDFAKTVCVGDWRLPTEAGLTLGLARGLASDLGQAHSRVIWADTSRASATTSAGVFQSPAKASAYCIEK